MITEELLLIVEDAKAEEAYENMEQGEKDVLEEVMMDAIRLGGEATLNSLEEAIGDINTDGTITFDELSSIIKGVREALEEMK